MATPRVRLFERVRLPALKLPVPSRRTMAFGVLAATALPTTVDACEPETSPAREPVKFVALVGLPQATAEPVETRAWPAADPAAECCARPTPPFAIPTVTSPVGLLTLTPVPAMRLVTRVPA